jgi:hypothetical protein
MLEKMFLTGLWFQRELAKSQSAKSFCVYIGSTEGRGIISQLVPCHTIEYFKVQGAQNVAVYSGYFGYKLAPRWQRMIRIFQPRVIQT